jgi:dihydroxyacid dehydratase/phosphogluconate dehydratase
VLNADGVYHKRGPARVFTSEAAAIAAIKENRIKPGDVMVLMGIGPLGTGMEETYQVTSALKHLPFGKHVALLTDARFSGVSTGACIGHIGPEALAGGPIGKVRDGDRIEIMVDTKKLLANVDLIGERAREFSAAEGEKILAGRAPHPGLAPHPKLPSDTRLWGALQQASGGVWGGCVFDADEIVKTIEAGLKARGAG